MLILLLFALFLKDRNDPDGNVHVIVDVEEVLELIFVAKVLIVLFNSLLQFTEPNLCWIPSCVELLLHSLNVVVNRLSKPESLHFPELMRSHPHYCELDIVLVWVRTYMFVVFEKEYLAVVADTLRLPVLMDKMLEVDSVSLDAIERVCVVLVLSQVDIDQVIVPLLSIFLLLYPSLRCLEVLTVTL